jgi:uncharacterized RDD family membrane protein YckC
MPSAETIHPGITPEAAAPEKRSFEPGAALSAFVLALACLMTVVWAYALVLLARWLIDALF